MSSEPQDGPGDVGPGEDAEQWEAMLRAMFGPSAPDVLAELRARGFDPAAAGTGLPADPQLMQHVIGQVQRLLTTPEQGPVNAEVAHDVARQVAVAGGDPVVTAAQAHETGQALSVAELWLDVATDLPPAGGRGRAWSRSEWVEATMPAWTSVVAPVAGSVADALVAVLGDQADEEPAEFGSMPGLPGLPEGFLTGVDPRRLIRRVGSAAFGMQIGQGAGTLSREVFGATDVGLPLLTQNVPVLVPANVEAFAEGLDAPLDEVRHYLALREAAHARLFTHVPWLRGHLLGLVDAYARGITIDLAALESRLTDIDVTDTEGIQRALSSGVFGIENTEAQKATLLRLETSLALVEGWVDDVTTRAALPHLPHAVALREMIQRRRAAGGPAERTFATLVGLELRPRRARDARALWARIAETSGPAARDQVWGHPDLLPDAVDLDDPAGYAARRAATRAEQADVDEALAEIFADDEPGEPR